MTLDTNSSHTSKRQRILVSLFIGGFIALQLLLPLRYYIVHRDPHDERFAWRMFSAMRMVDCTPRLAIAGVDMPLGGQFHEAWIEIAKRGRFSVLEKMGAALCAEHRGQEVRLSLDCKYLDQPARTWGGYNMCTVPEL
jgi:hypothetical protein